MRDYYGSIFKLRALENIKKGDDLNINLSSMTIKPMRKQDSRVPKGVALVDIPSNSVVDFHKVKDTLFIKPTKKESDPSWLRMNQNLSIQSSLTTAPILPPLD